VAGVVTCHRTEAVIVGTDVVGHQLKRDRHVSGRGATDPARRGWTSGRVGALSIAVVLLVSGVTAWSVSSAQSALSESRVERLNSRAQANASYLGAYLTDIADRLASVEAPPSPGDTEAWEALAAAAGLDGLRTDRGGPVRDGGAAAPGSGQQPSGSAPTWTVVGDDAGGHELLLPAPPDGAVLLALSMEGSSGLGKFLARARPGHGYTRALLTTDGDVAKVDGWLPPEVLTTLGTGGPVPSALVSDDQLWLLAESDVPSAELRVVIATRYEPLFAGIVGWMGAVPWLLWGLMTSAALIAAFLLTTMTAQRTLLRQRNAQLANRQLEAAAGAAIAAALNEVDDLEHAVVILRRELGHRLGAHSVEFVAPEALVEESRTGEVGTALPVLDGLRLRGFLRVVLTEPERDVEDMLRVLATSLGGVLGREDALRELRRSNDDLSRFAIVAAHDLQEPLRKVTAFSGLLDTRHGDQLSADAAEMLRCVVDGSQRMRHLVEDLLTYARVGAGGHEPRMVALEEVVREAADNLSLAIAETAGVVRVDPLPAVSGDAPLLVQLFQNLLGNALKFHAGPPRVQVGASLLDGAVDVTIRDEGIGVEPAEAERMFHLFERLHEQGRYPGVGLGLAISQRIVEVHGGRIWATSSPGSGTTVHVVLPSDDPSGRAA
jgi:signal transduction histidine kinase